MGAYRPISSMVCLSFNRPSEYTCNIAQWTSYQLLTSMIGTDTRGHKTCACLINMRTTTSIMSRITTYLAMFVWVVKESVSLAIEGVCVMHVEVMSFVIIFFIHGMFLFFLYGKPKHVLLWTRLEKFGLLFWSDFCFMFWRRMFFS